MPKSRQFPESQENKGLSKKKVDSFLQFKKEVIQCGV